MITKTLAVAVLAVRSALRSRLFLSLLVVLIFTVVWVPVAVKGDGTLAGKVRIVLHYSLGFASIILGAGALWTSCAAVSQEIENRQIRLIAAKPVLKVQLWFGKWLGLVFMNGALLAAVGAVSFGLLQWYIATAPATEEQTRIVREEIMVGRRSFLPRPDDVDGEAWAAARRLASEGRLTSDMRVDDAFRMLRRKMLAQRSTVAPGEAKKWYFDIPSAAAVQSDRSPPCWLRLRLSSSSWERGSVTGSWLVGTESDPERFSGAETEYRNGVHTMRVPWTAASGARELVVTFVNAPRARSATAVFDADNRVEFLVASGHFVPNLARSLLVILCYLAVLAALGLCAGAVFSFPVATFVSSSILAMVLISNYFTGSSDQRYHSAEDPVDTVAMAVGKTMARGIQVVARPMVELDPIERLADGVFVPWSMVARALLLMGIVYPATLGLAGGVILSRRELALPDLR